MTLSILQTVFYRFFTIYKNCIHVIFAASVKKTISFILIALFVNSSLLLPQLPDSFTDKRTANDDHMGSLIEWVNEILLDQKDDTPHEQDDNTLENSIEETYCHRLFQRSDLLPHVTLISNKLKFAEYPEGKLPILTTDVIAPPPEQYRS